MEKVLYFPVQQKPLSQKGNKWRKQCIDWADQRGSSLHQSLVRNSVRHKKINYDLLNGKLHMDDLTLVLNPDKIQAGYIPDEVQHYPIMNSKLEVLRGEESKRVFDYRVTVTNPNAVSEIEETKKKELFQQLQMLLADQSLTEEEYNQKLEDLNDFYTYDWQDIREIRANALLTHYVSEYNMPALFNSGFEDAYTVGEEIYQCDIIGGEPTIERINPLHIRVLRSGTSNKIEDADMIILEDYWSPGKIIDTYYDCLSKKDIDIIENLPNKSMMGESDSMDNIDERGGFINNYMVDDFFTKDSFYWDPFGGDTNIETSLLPYDSAGNIRVLRVYWKSRRKIKKIKSYDPLTGDVIYSFKNENYVTNTDDGEEEWTFYINEAWEGVKIGEDIYVHMRPRVVQYNRLSNPSRCHFGIVGTIYNRNESKPYSLVDMMKPYNYMYDVVFDHTAKLMAHNWGKLVHLDLAKIPKGWSVDKWLYFAKTNNLDIRDSFREGNYGASTGVLAAQLNSASSGVTDASFGNEIQFNLNLLQYIKTEMGEVIGISKQREGQVSNRETVGGVERATLQSSHITEWIFIIHDDTKRRALNCFLETAKIALKGRTKKFEYILPDKVVRMIEIDGDSFAENDYGLIVDNSLRTQKLNDTLDQLTQAAIQNQYQLSVIMKLYSSTSIAEKTRMLELYEKKMQEQQQQQQQQEYELQQQQIQAQSENVERELQFKDMINSRDNDTKVLVAEINSKAEADRLALMNQDDGVQPMSEDQKMQFRETIRQFNEQMKFKEKELAFQKDKAHKDQQIKLKSINKKPKTK